MLKSVSVFSIIQRCMCMDDDVRKSISVLNISSTVCVWVVMLRVVSVLSLTRYETSLKKIVSVLKYWCMHWVRSFALLQVGVSLASSVGWLGYNHCPLVSLLQSLLTCSSLRLQSSSRFSLGVKSFMQRIPIEAGQGIRISRFLSLPLAIFST